MNTATPTDRKPLATTAELSMRRDLRKLTEAFALRARCSGVDVEGLEILALDYVESGREADGEALRAACATADGPTAPHDLVALTRTLRRTQVLLSERDPRALDSYRAAYRALQLLTPLF